MKARLTELLRRDKVLPLFTPDDLSLAQDRLQALSDAGIQAIELTHRSPQTAEHFGPLRRAFPALLLGVGTILSAGDAEQFLALGADFLVSPCLVPEVAEVCRRAGRPYLPGAGTVREVFEAQQAGAEIVKLFPGEVLGPAFVRALLGPLPGSLLMVSGGVAPTPPGLEPWLDAGVLAAGLGSQLFISDSPTPLRQRVAELLAYTRAYTCRRDEVES
jgi:2-dehydro-3-deoxyphosphogluconate aldolase / (4S)-4-hydroxy-2-oxoglutarate aldolase